MSLSEVLRRLVGRRKAPLTDEVASGSTSAMAELAEKLAAQRGDNVTAGDPQPSDNAGSRLAKNASIAGIVSSKGEDDIISGG